MIELKPSASSYQRRGLLRAKQQDDKGAFRDYNKAIKLKPRFASAYLHRSFLFRKRKQHKSAIKDLKKYLKFGRHKATAKIRAYIAKYSK